MHERQPTTVITGATGLIGRRLLAAVSNPVVLSRRAGNLGTYAWDPEAGPPPAAALEGVDVVYNLAGEPVASGRWTDEKKRKIQESRTKGTRNLVDGLAALSRRPRVLVSASAVGFYGDRAAEELDETSTVGKGFLAEVCQEWEHEASRAESLGIRVVLVRIGVVLASDGGALASMLPAFKLGAGGRLGSGAQWMPWVHLDDVVGLLLHASQTSTLRGPMNAVAPAPTTNTEFTKALATALHRPAMIPVPTFALRLALGEMSDVVLASQHVLPRVAQQTGYTFHFRDLAAALHNVVDPTLSESRP